jgi:hypothetical protein
MINADGENFTRNSDGDPIPNPPEDDGWKTVSANFVGIGVEDGHYYFGDIELPLDHLEKWGEIIISEMAKNLLR